MYVVGRSIHSDQWRAYHSLTNNAHHLTVNHSISFVEATTGVHTQNIENTSMRVKRKQGGLSRHLLNTYLEEFMWRRQTLEKCNITN